MQIFECSNFLIEQKSKYPNRQLSALEEEANVLIQLLFELAAGCGGAVKTCGGEVVSTKFDITLVSVSCSTV